MKKLILTALITGSCLALQAAGFQDTFWGEDQGNGDGNPHITSWPNATAAENDFLSHLIGTGTETFETRSGGGPLPIVFPGAGSATLAAGGTIVTDPDSVTFGRFNTTPSGAKFWETSQNFSIKFSQPVAAFGFYAVDVGDFGGTLTLTLANGTTTTVTVPTITNPTGGSVEFFGYIDTEHPFTMATFGDTQPGVDFFAFDDMTIGSVEQVTPIPHGVPDVGSTALMLGLALGGLRLGNKFKKA